MPGTEPRLLGTACPAAPCHDGRVNLAGLVAPGQADVEKHHLGESLEVTRSPLSAGSDDDHGEGYLDRKSREDSVRRLIAGRRVH
jgi:hypothetical protein